MTVTYYPEMEQRSDEWLAARCGIITASVIGRMLSVRTYGGLDYECPDCSAPAGSPCRSLTRRREMGVLPEYAPIKSLHSGRTAYAAEHRDKSPLKVEPAAGDDAYQLTVSLLAERITQHVEQGYVSDAMWRGIVEEPLARNAYAQHHAPVTECGFVTREIAKGWRVGFSPDGLVGDDGAIEIKSRGQKAQVLTILADAVPTENLAQLHCGLFVTGREWIDYVSYASGMPLWVKRVYPDPMWMTAIGGAVAQFEAVVPDLMAIYQSRVEGLPVMERTPELSEIEVH